MTSTILRLPAIKAHTGLFHRTLHLRFAARRFPEPVALGCRAVGWVEAEVDGWLTRQIMARREVQPLRHKQRRRRS